MTRYPRGCGIIFFESREKIRQDADGPSGREDTTGGWERNTLHRSSREAVRARQFRRGIRRGAGGAKVLSGLQLMFAARVGAVKSRGLRRRQNVRQQGKEVAEEREGRTPLDRPPTAVTPGSADTAVSIEREVVSGHAYAILAPEAFSGWCEYDKPT